VFIAGGVLQDHSPPCPGVLDEYRIARANNRVIIPIAATGGAASEILGVLRQDPQSQECAASAELLDRLTDRELAPESLAAALVDGISALRQSRRYVQLQPSLLLQIADDPEEILRLGIAARPAHADEAFRLRAARLSPSLSDLVCTWSFGVTMSMHECPIPKDCGPVRSVFLDLMDIRSDEITSASHAAKRFLSSQ
jgi:hypothetical protein